MELSHGKLVLEGLRINAEINGAGALLNTLGVGCLMIVGLAMLVGLWIQRPWSK